MITNPQILQALEEVFDERIEHEIKELESEEPHVFSKKHIKKMTRMIRDQKKPYFKLICTSGRRAACIIITIIALSASALSVRAIREAIFDFITKNFSDHTVITTESGTDSGYPKTIEEEYYISELPEGFERMNYEKTRLSIDEMYIFKDDYIVLYQSTKDKYTENIDNNQTNYDYLIDDNRKYIIASNDYDTTIIWDDDKYVFTLRSNMNKETILKMCKSTKFKS